MVKLGMITGTSDTSRYYIRLTFDNKTKVIFGETVRLISIVRKVLI